MNPVYKEYFEILPSILQQFDALVYHAKDYQDYRFGKRHDLEKLAKLIPNGADEREFSVEPDPNFKKHLGILKDELILLTVGTLNGAKGHLEVARAFAKIDLKGRSAVLLLNGNQMPSQPNKSRIVYQFSRAVRFMQSNSPIRVVKTTVRIILSLVGIKFGYFADLKKCLRKIERLKDRNVICCNLDRKDLIQAFLAADLFVFASNIEYSPLVLYEACAAGLPFLSISVGNAHEISTWTSGGEVIPVEASQDGMVRVSSDVLASNIERLLGDPERLLEIGQAGRQSWRLRFNWGVLAMEYQQLFHRLCAGKNVQI
jgi:glycosyltransferase involved in cell wall biosynthesis